ncbi:hypothetical protein UPYG_G00146990 [Umbra pygmaea]|uniref:B-cell receptor CD22 n=1 Tax=Umbra pygmaea TaxID=75934 RepID=A0ABD0XH49_UMBPY
MTWCNHYHSESLLRCQLLNMVFNGRVSRIPYLVVLFVLLCVFFCNKVHPFTITKEHLTAKEGSCVKIECTKTRFLTGNKNKQEQWFWIKNPQWDAEKKSFNGIMIVSKNGTNQTLAPEYADRVKYTGSWNLTEAFNGESCSLVINNLKKTDSGIYKFRYQEPEQWITEPGLNITVEDEPCRVSVEDPPLFKEADNVTIKCSTSPSCGSYPEITGFRQTLKPSNIDKDKKKSSEVRFQASWQDDGRVLSCQPQGNKDECMIRSIKLKVEYAPKETKGVLSSSDIKEGDNVILTCSSRGHPNATHDWYKDSKNINEEAELRIKSIQPNNSGSYQCKATNRHGTDKSDVVIVDVKYVPKGVNLTADKSQYKEGQDLKFTCKVKDANPDVHSYTWYKGKKQLGKFQESTYRLFNLQPENSGSYYCEGINVVGQKKSSEYQLNVQYVPRNTLISGDNQLKMGSLWSLTCNTKAFPAPNGFTWYHRRGEQSPWRLLSNAVDKQPFERKPVTLADDGCYMCSATNDLGTGQNSSQSCIHVLYGPTQPVLSMARTAQEGHLLNIECEVQSFPASYLTLWITLRSVCNLSTLSSPSQPQQVMGCLSPSTNTLQCSFNITLFNNGVYTCKARNSEGENSTNQELEITYSPREVMALAQPDTILHENRQLSFTCKACSNPPVTAYTWVHTMEGDSRTVGHVQSFTVTSITPSQRGNYSCTAQNSLGTGKSQQVEVKVKYAPKHTEVIHNMTTTWQSNGLNPVALACHSHSYPPVHSYKWFRSVEGRDIFVTEDQNITVQPDMPGTYYCVATNTLGGKESNRVELFLRRVLYRVLFSLMVIIVLLIPTFLLYKHKKKKSIQQGTSSKLACCAHLAFLGWRSGTTENLVNDPQASSRDELWSDRLYQPEPLPQSQCAQPTRTLYPDSTSPSGINTVYCVLNAPGEQQGHSPSQRLRTKGGHKGHSQDDVDTYSMVKPKGQEMSHLGKTDKGKECEIYAKVVKPKLKEKNNKQDVYENISGACAPILNTERESSEDDMDVEINYSDVKFTAKPGHQNVYGSNHHHNKASHNNSSSSDDEVYKIQYSDVKI